MHSLGLPNHSIRREIDADAVIQVEAGDDPRLGLGRSVAARSECHLVVDIPPAAVGSEACGDVMGDDRDGQSDRVTGQHVGFLEAADGFYALTRSVL